ncbi:MAG: carbohydrate ABC transporter permease [Mycobacteriales bacterium]
MTIAAASVPTPAKAKRGRQPWTAKKKRDFWWGMLFCSPAIIGLLWFTAYPILMSLYYSFTSYTMVGHNTHWIGLTNYRVLFHDGTWWSSLQNTFYMMLFLVPVGIIFALILALLLNLKVRFQSFYRTIFYLPTIAPLVASVVAWSYIFDPQFGVLDDVLRRLHVTAPGWLTDPGWTKPALVVFGLWGVGNLMIILLAGLQEVPVDLQDAAKVDGAGVFSRLRHITVPFMSPYLLFALITGLIAIFQYFTPPYVLFSSTTGAGPANSAILSSVYLYQNAFVFFKVGYASAMAWCLFVIVAVITVVTFRFVGRRVYYAGS